MSYFDDNEHRIIHGGGRRSRRDPWCATCKDCGMTGLKWRIADGGGWRLYENVRVEHNRLKEHVCPQNAPSPDGFEDVPDA